LIKDFEEQRNNMVETQIIARGVRDLLVIQAMRTVPRHKFVDENLLFDAYKDYPLPIGNGQTISQPYMVAVMTELLELKGGEKVLEVGTGSGYQAAVLAEIVNYVYSVERIPELANRARNILKELHYNNIFIKTGDGTLGWEEFAPYDGIIVTAGAPSVPMTLFEQLKEGERLVIPIGGGFEQVLTLIKKVDGKLEKMDFFGCVFVRLVGKYGWHGA